MKNLRQWLKYDTFKLIVAIILAALLIGLMFGPGKDPQVPVSGSPEDTTTTPGINPPAITPTQTRPPTSTSTMTSSPTPTQTPTLTISPTITSTPTFTPTFTPTATATESPEDICSLAIQTRLDVDQSARVLTNLNFREAPGLDQEIILVHLTNDRLDIVGGPVCTRHLDGAYRWWQVERSDGMIGWSAEGSYTRFFYFLEPEN